MVVMDFDGHGKMAHVNWPRIMEESGRRSLENSSGPIGI
jgi:hypothetical protein